MSANELPVEGIHRTLPDGNVISLYRQLYNFKITRSSAQSWPHTYDDSW